MTMLDIALSYAERGLPVFPLVPRSKVPLISKAKGGNGCLSATCERKKITEWWTDCPCANIGLATGSASGIDVLDVDPRHNGDKSLATLIQKHGRIGKTPIVQTGGGGLHVLFRHHVGLRGNAGIIGEGLDIRADGNYVVAAGSIHESGNAYEWKHGLALTDVPLANFPQWLLDLSKPSTPALQADLPENWRKLVAEGISEGGRNTAISRLSGHLLRRYVDPLVTLDLVRIWNLTRCVPPLDDDEVIRTVNNIAAREQLRRGGKS